MASLSPTEIRQYVTCPKCGKTGDPSGFSKSKSTGARPRRDPNTQCLDCVRDKRIRWQYNMTISDYDRLLESQDGGCAVCRRPAEGRNLHIDHDHSCCPGIKSCGKCIRGLLCGHCNKALGHMNDSVDDIMALAAYIMERSNG